MRWACLLTLALGVGCANARRYYVLSELPVLEDEPALAVVPGPWPEVPAVLVDTAGVPDALVIPALRALMALPGAADACDPGTGRPRPDATEYCVALYRTPEDWRVSWPLRNVSKASSLCQPPFGGVEDADFGRDLPVFGYAHNHPCGTHVSRSDLGTFPMVRSDEGLWVMVAYGATPSGKLARDARGQLIPAWGWLATGHRDAPRFYRWNPVGEVFRWNEGKKQWEFQAKCQPQESLFSRHPPPLKCTPELKD